MTDTDRINKLNELLDAYGEVNIALSCGRAYVSCHSRFMRRIGVASGEWDELKIRDIRGAIDDLTEVDDFGD